MTAPEPNARALELLVAHADPDHARRVYEALCALGFHAAVVSSAEAAETVNSGSNALVVTDTAAFLQSLCERLSSARDAHADETAEDESAFLERAARILAAAQPPNDHVAILAVHVELPAATSDRTELVEAEIARRLRACVRDRDAIGRSVLGAGLGAGPSLARFGGRDAIVLLPGLPRSQAAYKVARRLHERLVEPIATPAGPVAVQCAIGIAVHPGDGPDPRQMLERARAAERAAANATPPAVRFHSATMNAAAERRQRIEDALVVAVANHELTVHYQPKVEIATGRIVGCEALARWTHAELGSISPALFIPIAEENGLIHAIGEFVLAAACRQNRAWQDQGLAPLRVAVNLSTVQLREERLLATLRSVLADTRLDPQWLELELTESVLVEGIDLVLQRLGQLKKLGLHLSIDDFGTGYSSLSYLKRFPIDTLKIDQAFVRDLTTDKYDAAITTSIVLLGQSLKLHVVAEGVETRGQLEFLRMLRCDEAQGFLFSKPLPADEFAALLRRGIDPKLLNAGR